MGHLLSVFEIAIIWLCLSRHTVIPELLLYGSDFSAQVSLPSQANNNNYYYFFQDSLPGVSHCVYLTYDVVVLENTHLVKLDFIILV